MTRRTAALAVLSMVLVAGLEPTGSPATSEVLAVPATAGSGSSAASLVSGASLGAPAPSPRAASLVPQASPSGELTGPIYTASATWCAPRGKQCTGWAPPAMLGAVFGFRWGDEPWTARVWRGQVSVDVLVVSFCACGGTHNAIDLSPAAFADLAEPGREPDDYSSLSRGRLDVLVEVLGEGPRVAATAPPTDR